ncbi:MAG TPA: hypothetical protein VF476_09260 [Chitinophagaceae bacterium]
MKRLLVGISVLCLFSGCKKMIEKIAEDMVMKAMTDGQWYVKDFVHNGTNITTSFSAYKFQYYRNKTVDAINNGSVEKTGTWDGNASTMTTSANFTGATNPLNLINGNWKIDNNSWTFVEATQNINGETKRMRLEKL